MDSDIQLILTSKGELGQVVKTNENKIHYKIKKPNGPIAQKSQPSNQYKEVTITIYATEEMIEEWKATLYLNKSNNQ